MEEIGGQRCGESGGVGLTEEGAIRVAGALRWVEEWDRGEGGGGYGEERGRGGCPSRKKGRGRGGGGGGTDKTGKGKCLS